MHGYGNKANAAAGRDVEEYSAIAGKFR